MKPVDLAPLILHVTSVEYSARTLLLPQLSELQRAGFRVRIATSPENGEFGSDLVPFAPLRLDFPRAVRPLAVARAMNQLVQLVRDDPPAILHLHTPAAALPARLLPRRLFPPRTRIAYTAHGFPFQWDHLTRLRDRALERTEWLLSRRADLLFLQSREDFDEARSHRFGGRIVFLGNGVEDRWFDVTPPVRQPGRLRLLYVGRVVREKGVLDLIEAMRSAPSAELTVTGGQIASERDGVMSEAQALVARHQLERRVRFLGYVDRREMTGVVSGHDALVLPSYREGVPRSIIEGMAASRPAVVSDVRGCRELVSDGASGFVVPVREPTRLAEVIERLAALDSAPFAKLAAEARRVAEASYREHAVIERLLAGYASIGVVPGAGPEAPFP